MAQIERPARFLLQTLDGKVLHEYLLNSAETTVGRASTRAISIPADKLISRRHALVRYVDDHYVLCDEGSVNGTIVNGKPLQPGQTYILHHGDSIRLGRHQLIFQDFSSTTPAAGSPTGRSLSGGLVSLKQPAGSEALANASGPLTTDTVKSASVYSAPTQILSPDQLRFTAFYPQEVAVGTWNSLLVYAHLAHLIEVVHQDAATFKSETAVHAHKTSEQSRPFLLQNTSVTVVPECKGISFNPKRITFKWLEDWHRVEFRFSTKKEWAGLNANGRISLFAGPLLVGTLRLALLLDEPHLILQEDIADITARLYRPVYASYSPQDVLIGLQSRAIYKALGSHASIIDDALRTDQQFSAEQKRMIEAAEVFQVFWSSHGAHSPLVAQELEYALQLNRGEGFIRPIYWEVPRVPPPEKLASVPFTYLPLYTFCS
ncbi:MAG TPA: FHA domain-containing protein [Ktedonosporobacter sp.]|nr:FHA domain-containing protein [Ktedonosporobacter sp.]